MIQGMRAWCAWTGSKDDNVGNGGLQEGPGIVFSKPWFGTLNLCHVLFVIKIGSELTRMCVSQMPLTAAVTGGAASGGGGRGRGEVSPRPLSRVMVAGHVRFPAEKLSGGRRLSPSFPFGLQGLHSCGSRGAGRGAPPAGRGEGTPRARLLPGDTRAFEKNEAAEVKCAGAGMGKGPSRWRSRPLGSLTG